MSSGRSGGFHHHHHHPFHQPGGVEDGGSWGPTALLLPPHAHAPPPPPASVGGPTAPPIEGTSPAPREDSDCGGSSSGLGGMHASNRTSDSESDDPDGLRPACRPRGAAPASSKQSGTSSSGKGSSTGASPTSQPPSLKTGVHPNPSSGMAFATSSPGPTPTGLKTSGGAAVAGEKDGSSVAGSHSSGPSTSSVGPTATGGHLSDGVSSNGTLKGHHPPPLPPHLHHHIPPTPHDFHHHPPAPLQHPNVNGCSLEYVGGGVGGLGVGGGAAGVNNPLPTPLIPATGPGTQPPPPYYAMTVAAPLDPAAYPPSSSGAGGGGAGGPPPRGPAAPPSSSYSIPAVAPSSAAPPPPAGPVPAPAPPPPVPAPQGPTPASSTPSQGGPGAGLTTPTMPPFPPLGPGVAQHAVYVHVNLGETLSVRVGNDIQHIQGPATVRMVSGSLGPPVPLPLHVPPGHIVQQIVDQEGTLRHLILSPQHPPPLHPVVGAPSFAASSSPVSGPNAGGGGGGYARTPPPGAPFEAAGHEANHVGPAHHAHHHPHPGPGGKAGFRASRGADAVRGPTPSDFAPPSAPDLGSTSGASNDDEDSDKIKVFLSRIRAPTVHEIGPRDALVRWEALDCTEASAPGGPFPYIDSSEFTYEVLVAERTGHRNKTPVSRSLVHKFVSGENEGSQQRLSDLRPSTEYTVKVRADLPDRGISGEPSHAVEFKTKPTQPDKPSAPTVIKRGKNFLNLGWKKPPDNGAKIMNYRLECDTGRGQWTQVYEGPDERTRLLKLQPNSAYGLRLSAVNGCGASVWSDVFMAHTSGAPPSQPDPPTLSRAEPDSLSLVWTKRPGEDRFSLQMEDTESGHGFIVVGDTTEPAWTVRNLLKAKLYAFRLTSENEDGKSVPSEPVSFRTPASRPGVPGKPYLKDRVKSSSLRLSWEPPRDSGGADIAQYLLEYCAEEPGSPRSWTTLYSGPVAEYGVQGLLPGTAYRFRVSCSGEGGGSACSEVLAVSTTPLPPSPPSTPALVRAKPNSLSIRWDPPNNSGGAEVTEYEVVMASPAKPHPMAPATVFQGLKREITLPNLLPGRIYRTKVRAMNRAGPGGWSNELAVETSAGAPDAVSALRLSSPPASSSVRLEWDPPFLTNGAPVSEYRVYQSEEDVEASTEDERFSDFAQAWSGTANTVELRGLSPATSYGFQLRAANAAGLSSPSETLVITTPPGLPGPPSGLLLEPTGQTTLSTTWEPAADSGSPITSYRLELMGIGQTLEVEDTEAVVEELEPETSYRLRVAAVNAIGLGAWSQSASASTYSRPPLPPSLDIVGTPGHNLLKLKWTDTRPSPEPLSYQLEMENRSNTFSPIYEGSLKSHKVPRLTESTAYRFRIRATSPTGGIGVWSDVFVFHTARSPPPPLKSPPKVTEVGEGMWQVEWVPIKASVLPKGDRLQYLLELQENGEWHKKYQGSANSYTLSGLRTGVEYRVRVGAVRLSRIGERPEPVEETPGPPTAAAASFSASTGGRKGALAQDEAGVRRQDSGYESKGGLGGTESSEEEMATTDRRLSDSQWALVILAGFSLAAVLIAYLIQTFIAA